MLTIAETIGAAPTATIEIIDEPLGIRVRVCEPGLGKASIYLTDDELVTLSSEIDRILQSRRTA